MAAEYLTGPGYRMRRRQVGSETAFRFGAALRRPPYPLQPHPPSSLLPPVSPLRTLALHYPG